MGNGQWTRPATLDASALRALKLDFQGIRGTRMFARKYLSAARVNVYASGNWLSFTDGGGGGEEGDQGGLRMAAETVLLHSIHCKHQFRILEWNRLLVPLRHRGGVAPHRNRYQLIFRFHFRPCKPGALIIPVRIGTGETHPTWKVLRRSDGFHRRYFKLPRFRT